MIFIIGIYEVIQKKLVWGALVVLFDPPSVGFKHFRSSVLSHCCEINSEKQPNRLFFENEKVGVKS